MKEQQKEQTILIAVLNAQGNRSAGSFSSTTPNRVICAEAKKILAYEVTKIVRGEDDANEALEIANNTFNANIIDERLPNVSIKKLDLLVIARRCL